MIVKRFSEKHFEYLVECKLAVELKLDILHDGINVFITQAGSCDKIGPLELLYVQYSVLIVVNNLERLHIKFITAIHNHFTILIG